MFGVAVCKIQASVTSSLHHLCRLIKEAASVKVKGASAVQLPLDRTFALRLCVCPLKVGHVIDILKPSIHTHIEERDLGNVYDLLLLSNLYLLLGKTRRRC